MRFLTYRNARRGLGAASALALMLAVPAAAGAHHRHGHDHGTKGLRSVDRIVVIYEENHSFDNLYGGWEGVRGRSRANASQITQVGQNGAPLTCLMQNDVNLTSPPLSTRCSGTTATGTPFNSHFLNELFQIDDYIAPSDTTCPDPKVFAPNGVPKGSGLPGGCTRDLVHRYYQEQYQLNHGRQNRYTTGSDAVGLTQGYYDTTQLPIYKYLHTKHHPHYAIADDFFQSAFGGSFLNHQWLISARTPTWPGADNTGGPDDLHSVVDANGMPTNYPMYQTPSATPLGDRSLTASCNPGPGRGPTLPGTVCGDFAVNTTQPPYQPYAPGTAPARRLPPQTAPTIGDRLSDKGIDWAWYAGGWSNADGDVGGPGWTNGSTPGTCTDPNHANNAVWPNCPDALFQYHHQPFNYYVNYAPGTAARTAHLRDEQEFIDAANSSSSRCKLKPVSFIKPIGEENEHPGYASAHAGSSHLVDLLTDIQDSRCAKDTMVVVTYDEFGGQWDHVSPPGQGGAPGPHDIWGPGTRIPALVLAPGLRHHFAVDHTQYDTTSIMATIERRFGLQPVATRDAAVNDMSEVFEARSPRHHHHHD